MAERYLIKTKIDKRGWERQKRGRGMKNGFYFVREKIMFDTDGGRRIEDTAKEGRIEYMGRGLGMANFYKEVEGQRMKKSEGSALFLFLKRF